MHSLSARAMAPCWEFVTCMSWFRRPPGSMELPDAGSSQHHHLQARLDEQLQVGAGDKGVSNKQVGGQRCR